MKQNKARIAFVVSAVVMVVAVLIICICLNGNINQFRSESVTLYSWANEERITYNNAELVFDTTKSNAASELKIDGKTVEIDSTPFFYEDERKVLFPQEMVIVRPRVNNGEQNRLPALSFLDGTSTEPKVVYADVNEMVGAAFLFDGRDLYFFVNPVTLEVDGEKIPLSEFSYATYNFNHELYAYDYNSGAARYFGNANSVKASTDKYSIDLVSDTFEVNNKSRLLVTNPGVLETLK